jgi:NAD(P)-dependent dehydrogenase (short-subunit alcohol dehydrogenase family)
MNVLKYKNMPKLQNKIAFITGAAGGIGKSIAVKFLSEGATVVISDVCDERGEVTAKELGEKCTYMHLDVSKEEEWQKVLQTVYENFGKINILVNNAGILGLENPTWGPQDPENASLESWKMVHSINSDSVFLGCKYAIKYMKQNGVNAVGKPVGGVIVNMSSRSGMVGVPTTAAYASSKASVRNHTKSVALYCAGQGYNIRCNSIHPAAILTHMWECMLGDESVRDENIKKLSHDIPLGHMGTPEDVANVAAFLASDESAFMTGEELVIDGGILAGTSTSPRKGE